MFITTPQLLLKRDWGLHFSLSTKIRAYACMLNKYQVTDEMDHTLVLRIIEYHPKLLILGNKPLVDEEDLLFARIPKTISSFKNMLKQQSKVDLYMLQYYYRNKLTCNKSIFKTHGPFFLLYQLSYGKKTNQPKDMQGKRYING